MIGYIDHKVNPIHRTDIYIYNRNPAMNRLKYKKNPNINVTKYYINKKDNFIKYKKVHIVTSLKLSLKKLI